MTKFMQIFIKMYNFKIIEKLTLLGIQQKEKNKRIKIRFNGGKTKK